MTVWQLRQKDPIEQNILLVIPISKEIDLSKLSKTDVCLLVIKLKCKCSKIKIRFNHANTCENWLIVIFWVFICKTPLGRNKMSFSLITIIKAWRLYYFVGQMKYWILLTYFKNVTNIREPLFESFIQVTINNMILTFFMIILLSILSDLRSLFLKTHK